MLKVFIHYFPSHTLQQAVFDGFLLFAAFVFAASLQVQGGGVEWQQLVLSAVAFAGIMILLNGVTGLYRLADGRSSAKDAAVAVGFALGMSVPIALAVFHILPWEEGGSEAVRLSILLALGLVLGMRGLVSRRRAASMFMPRVLIIGTGSDAGAVEHSLSHPVRRGIEVVGFYPSTCDDATAVDEARVLHAKGGLLEVVRAYRVNEIIVAVRERRGGVLPIRELLDCKLMGIRVLDLSSFFERTQGQVRIDSLKASWLIYGDGFRQGWSRTAIKRCFDLLAATTLLVLAVPVMLVTALLILLEDGAPVFYRQERVGQGGRVFRVIKFRSMCHDAEKDGRPRWARTHDDRVTRVGRVIRRLRIDELPQLFNVLMGDMSLVGPRPERPFFVDQLGQEIPFYSVRHCVKPGVTGWAQVRYRYGASVDDAIQKLQYDLYYVKNHTLVLDTLVLFETVRVVLTGEGAH